MMRVRWWALLWSIILVMVGAAPPAHAQGDPVGGSGADYYLNDQFTGIANNHFQYGDASDVVFFGDWDGDGIDTPMIRRGNQFLIRNSNSSGAPDVVVRFGDATDRVVVGDWDGNGTDTLMVRRGHEYYVKNTIASGYADYMFAFGDPTDVVLSGDWDGNGTDTLTVRRGHQYFVKNSMTTGYADYVFGYGNPDDLVLVGDWNGDALDTLGVRRGNQYLLKDSTTTGYADIAFSYGDRGDTSFTGDFNGDGRDTIGVRRQTVTPPTSIGVLAAAQLRNSFPEPSVAQSRNALAGLVVAAPGSMVGYDRALFPHWRDADRWGWPPVPVSTCDVRQAALYREGEDVQYDSACTIYGGKWLDAYTTVTLHAASDVDVDHIVPLAEAWRTGASSWTTEQRTAFANDKLEVLAVDDGANASKGDKTPDLWKPPNRDAHCLYAKRWIAIKDAYHLTANPNEVVALEGMLNTCAQ